MVLKIFSNFTPIKLNNNHLKHPLVNIKKHMDLKIKTTLALLVFTFFILNACKPIKSALERNNKKYSKIENRQNNSINTEGIYVFKQIIESNDSRTKNNVISEFIKFNKNKTVQFSKKHDRSKNKEAITNKNITNWLNPYASSYYYTKNHSKLIVEHYIANPIRKSWYALDGPTSAPLKFKLQFKIKGDTLIKNNKKYILNKSLTHNHKNIMTDFITFNE